MKQNFTLTAFLVTVLMVFVTALVVMVVLVGQVQAQESMTISGNVSSNEDVQSGLEVTLDRVANEQTTRIASTITDSSGTYSFEIESGEYLVNVSFEDITHHSMASPQNPVVDFDFSGRIEGWVVHADGKDVSGITLNLMSSINTICATTITDGAGHYEFTNVDLSEHWVQADYMYVGYSNAGFIPGCCIGMFGYTTATSLGKYNARTVEWLCFVPIANLYSLFIIISETMGGKTWSEIVKKENLKR